MHDRGNRLLFGGVALTSGGDEPSHVPQQPSVIFVLRAPLLTLSSLSDG